jgi:cobalt/nickel transport system ATP-binding protein
MTAPLLEFADLCLELDGRPVLDSIRFTSSGERIGLLGEGRHVLSALHGEVTVSSGKLLIAGVELDQARRTNLFGIARAWPDCGSVPYRFTVREGLTFAAMLSVGSETEARHRSDAALARLGLQHLGERRLGQRVGLEHYLAGLVEAALFEPPVVVVDWPMGVLNADAWARYGTALSRLVQKRRWIVGGAGPARLPVEQAWLGALDQLVFLDGSLCVGVPPGIAQFVRTLLVLAVEPATVERVSENLGFTLEPAAIRVRDGQSTAAYVVELPRDEYGRPCTSAILDWCDQYQLPIVRLEPLEGVC